MREGPGTLPSSFSPFHLISSSFEWKAMLTGGIDVEYVHRVTEVTKEEKKEGGMSAEWCIMGA